MRRETGKREASRGSLKAQGAVGEWKEERTEPSKRVEPEGGRGKVSE